MKKTAIILCFIFLLALYLVSCSFSSPAKDTRLYTYPGTDWTMTPDELIIALELTEGEYTVYPPEDAYDEYYIAQPQAMIFGTIADIEFRFSDVDLDGVYYLYGVRASFPNNTDFESLKLGLTEQYGEPESGKHIEWNTEAVLYDFLSEEDRELLTEMTALDQRYFAETPAATIRLITEGTADGFYQGESTNKKLDFISGYAHYVLEGGIPKSVGEP